MLDERGIMINKTNSTSLPSYCKHFRSELTTLDPIDNKTKDLKRNFILSKIASEPSHYSQNILRATINCLTGVGYTRQLKQELDDETLQAIKYLTANSTEYGCFGIGVKDIPAGAAHILFAVAYALRKQIDDFDDYIYLSRDAKIQLINDVINFYIATDENFPNLPRDKDDNMRSNFNSLC